MYFDALTTAAIRDELAQKALGGWVRKVMLPSDDMLAAEIYARGQPVWLIASFNPRHAHVRLTQQRLHRTIETESPLLLLLRKYVRDGRLANVEQLPLERVLILTVAKRLVTPEGEERATECKLIIEIMGRYSNIILADDEGIVLDCAKRIYPSMNRYRVTLPHHPYTPPPPQDKLSPLDCSPASLASVVRLAPSHKPVWQTLVEGFRATSPLLAREVVYRATGRADTSVGDLLAEPDGVEMVSRSLVGLMDPIETHQWQPSIATEGDVVTAFAPYLLTHIPNVAEAGTVSEALARFYLETEAARPHQLARARLLKLIEQERERIRRKIGSLEAGLAKAADTSRLRMYGELILAHASGIEPGQRTLEIDNLRIDLNPQLTAIANAQAYFHEYAKAKAASSEVPTLLDEARTALAYLDEEAALVELAEDEPMLAQLRDELLAAGLCQTSPSSGGPA